MIAWWIQHRRVASKALLATALATSALAAPLTRGRAQASPRGQPTTPFAAADLAKLRWLEGTWRGSAPGEADIYERYRFLNDSTVEITYFSDSTLMHPTNHGRVYLSVGHIYHTMGPGRWGATHVDADGAYFVPQVNAQNTFAWTHQSPDAWTITLRSGFAGRDRVSVYQMRRTRP